MELNLVGKLFTKINSVGGSEFSLYKVINIGQGYGTPMPMVIVDMVEIKNYLNHPAIVFQRNQTSILELNKNMYREINQDEWDILFNKALNLINNWK